MFLNVVKMSQDMKEIQKNYSDKLIMPIFIWQKIST